MDQDLRPSLDTKPAVFSNFVQECLFIFAMSSAMGMGSLLQGATIVLTIPIGKSLDMDQAEITWIAASNALTAGAFLLFFGQLADGFGKKVVLLAGLVAFSACMLVSAWATNPLYLIIFGALLGVCAAAVTPAAIGLVGAVYSKPSRRKNRAFASLGAANPIGFVLGSVIAGAMTRPFGWRGAYITLAIMFVVITVIGFLSIPASTINRSTRGEVSVLASFDFLGAILNIVGLILLITALTIAPSAPEEWATPYVIVLLVMGITTIAAFILWQRFAEEPLMPLHHWRNTNFSMMIISTTSGFMCFTSSQFWLSIFLQDVKALSPLHVAVYLIPQAAVGLAFNVVAGLMMHRVRNEYLMALGAVCYIIGAVLLANMKADSSYWAFIFPALITMVIGVDLQQNIANVFISSHFAVHQQAKAGGIMNMLMRLCVSLGLAFTTAIFSSTAVQDQQDLSVEPYCRTFYLCMAFAGVSSVASFFLRIGKQGASETDATRDPGLSQVLQASGAGDKASENISETKS